MVQEDVPLADFVEDPAARRQLGHRLGRILRSLQMVKTLQAVHLHQYGQIQGPVYDVQIVFLDMELILQNPQQPPVAVGRHLQPNGLAPLALLQLLLDFLQKVCRLVLLNGKVGITHYSKRISTHNVIVQEQLMHVPLDDLLQEDHLAHLPIGGQLHHPAQDARHLHCGELQLLAYLLLAHQGGDVQGLVPNQRKRPGGVHRHGRQHRIHVLLEIFVHEDRFLLRQVLMPTHNLQTVLFQLRHQRTVVGGVLQLHQLVNRHAQKLKLPPRRQPRYVRLLVLGVHHVPQGSHPDHKEFIQVGGGDAQELQPLKQKCGFVPGLVQHPVVEQNPAQFPVRIKLWIIKIDSSCGMLLFHGTHIFHNYTPP